MKIEVKRYSDNGDSTTGLVRIDGQFECYSLEDEYRKTKVMGETRIPNGVYEVQLRTEGGFDARYRKRFDFHEGMLELQDVPNFKYVLIHCGNTEKNTAGCLLVGDTINNNQKYKGFLGDSAKAYATLYKKVINAINKGEKVIIKIQTI